MVVFVQVAVGALGGRACIRIAPFPQNNECVTVCCEEGQVPDQTPDRFVSLSDLGLPIDSDCCVQFGSDAMMLVADHRGLQDHDELVAPMDAPRADPIVIAPARATIRSGRAAHPPPSLAMVRTTILLI